MIEVTEMYVAPQGEGRNMGRPSIFLRLRRCVLTCDWCDSKFTWDETNEGYGIFQTFSPEVLVHNLVELGKTYRHWPEGLVITGGEPMIYQRELPEVLRLYNDVLQREHVRLSAEIETAGTIVPTDEMLYYSSFNVSPKLNSAGNEQIPIDKLWNQQALRKYVRATERAFFKLVIGDGDEVSLGLFLGILKMVASRDNIKWADVARRVYLMPEGQTAFDISTRQEKILDLAMEHGVNATTRMHVIAYDDERRR